MEAANAAVHGRLLDEVAVESVAREEDWNCVHGNGFDLNKRVQLGDDEIDVDDRDQISVRSLQHDSRARRNFDGDRDKRLRTAQENMVVVVSVVVAILVKKRKEFSAHHGVFKLGKAGG